jgi:MYXO-CTERM domain-containing protein
VDYLYQVELFDPGYFDTFDYVLESSPENMAVDEFGVVSWTPESGQEGDWVIKLVVTDDDGGESTQIETITVGGGTIGDDDDDDDCSCDHDASADGRGAVLVLLAALMLARRRSR